MNYLISLALCVAFTVLHALGEGAETYWLIISDLNVAVWLFIAWVLEPKNRRGIDVNLTLRRGE